MEKDVVHIAIENLYQNTGIQGQFIPDAKLDGMLQLETESIKTNFLIEVKKEIRSHQLRQLNAYNHRYNNFMVVAEHIFPKIKEELREMGIAYLEANGNLFTKNKHIYLFIDSNKKATLKRETANRAFTKTGLKVVFHLLNDKLLVNKTQREVADTVGVGLGNIPQVISGLRQTGYLVPFRKQEYVWQNRKELLDRWINAYATELRPKLLKGKYAFKKDWQTIQLDNKHTVWGGELAADKLTNHLRPENFILYTDEKQKGLITNYHIVPQKNGELEVLEIFWEPKGEVAPPIIIYADLMLTGGKRNKETAEKIFNEYIQPNL